MNKLKRKIEDLMVAITFAESGEYDEASRLSCEAQEEKILQAEGVKKTAMERAGK